MFRLFLIKMVLYELQGLCRRIEFNLNLKEVGRKGVLSVSSLYPDSSLLSTEKNHESAEVRDPISNQISPKLSHCSLLRSLFTASFSSSQVFPPPNFNKLFISNIFYSVYNFHLSYPLIYPFVYLLVNTSGRRAR